MTDSIDNVADPRAFRRALGNFATGITIVTAALPDGTQVGVTANSFNSVSLDPPLILWSIDKRAHSYAVFDRASHFAVNVLAADQMNLSNQFARAQDDKFSGVVYAVGLGGAPLLSDCSARFQCEKHQLVDGGDHWIMIGKVVAFDDCGRAPLLYHQGAYSMVLPYPRLQKKEECCATDSAMAGRLKHNVFYLLTQALRSYQANYQPKQLSSGLRTSEARMLMVLENDAELDMDRLLTEVAMPAREIEEAEENLRRKGMVANTGNGYHLTEAGIEQAETLWDIAAKQQDAMLSDFSEDEVALLRKVLRKIITLR
ncbi:p-hydroxyphenylacetate 3-hydroxylase reductase component [Budvicia aquatica]|uniref:Flavin oxidoreductase n=1 Tax=Budvicia aquatica TaxID=82979 RepID=A0A2C6DS86_9GAMM|nr:flavin reductase [Budvicia aquatica]PHI31563.1 flavin oxidoreductase [Budvicia aquatica]VFS52074.1 p-hydroxyphenylacetate 3-hydroxylase, reductase component [Budvicia aquatica]